MPQLAIIDMINGMTYIGGNNNDLHKNITLKHYVVVPTPDIYARCKKGKDGKPISFREAAIAMHRELPRERTEIQLDLTQILTQHEESKLKTFNFRPELEWTE